MPDEVREVKSYHYGWDTYWTSYDFPTGADKGHQSGSQSVFLGNAHRSGVQNPHFRDQIRSGQNATTSLVGEDWSASVNPYFIEDACDYEADGVPLFKHSRTSMSSGIYQYPFNPSQVFLDSSEKTKCINRCIQDFLDNCNRVLSSFEAGQDLGEYKETLHSIHKPLGSLQTYILNYFTVLQKERQLLSIAKRLPKVLADTYLEWRFGINPLVSDVASAIADAGRFRFPVVPVKGHGHVNYSSSTLLFNPTIGSTTGVYRVNLRNTASYSMRYKGAIRSHSSASGKIGLAQSLQLLPENWAPTLWDLLPYSWIADYFFNVGEIIKGLSFVSSNLVWACKTDKQQTKLEYSDLSLDRSFVIPNGYHKTREFYNVSGGRATFLYKNVSRGTLLGSDLIPTFTFQVPVGKYPFVNMGALLISRGRQVSRWISNL